MNTTSKPPLLSKRGQTRLALGTLLAAVALALVWLGWNSVPAGNDTANEGQFSGKPLQMEDIPFNGRRAMQYLSQLCEIGPRFSGSPGMQKQQQLLIDHFQKLGATVETQRFGVPHPRTRERVIMTNLLIHWHPETKERILLCAHYDTRPFPDRDETRPQGTFVGANDGGSGTAILMEMGHAMPELGATKLGVDFVLFDGEELVYSENDPYFLGAEYFARELVASPPGYRYRSGVLLDMVGDEKLQLFQELNSVSWRDTKPLVTELWGTARRLHVREFIPQTHARWNVRDDHVPLHEIAHIPVCDVIDFDYPYWHTEEDVPHHCSALSLAKVGWVVQTWLEATVKK